MRQVASRFGPFLHVTRLTSAFAGVANIWFVILWSLGAGDALEPGGAGLADLPRWALLLGGAANAIGLYAFGAALNDVLDRRRDQTIHPGRPIPSGRLSPDRAIALVLVTFIVAVAGATILGGRIPVFATLAIAGVILLLNAIGRFVPGIGLVILGLVYAGHMLVPNPELVFLWPVWLVLTHALAVGALTHVLAGRVPRLSKRGITVLIVGWLFWSGVIGWLAWTRTGGGELLWPGWIDPWGPAAAGALAVLFVLLIGAKVRRYGRTQRAADKIARYGGLWLALYGFAFLAGQGYGREALVLAGLAGAGVIGSAIVREVHALVEHPLTYRR